MIVCTVCGTENSELSILCSSCKGFLQGRVDALDLFSTIWGLLESPQATFRRIVLAKHKNYSVMLSALFGICLALDIAWYKSLARIVPGLPMLLGAALLAGPLLGVLLVFIAAVILKKATVPLGGIATRNNLFAALAYATMPMAVSLVFLVPLEIAVFGKDFFGTNPPPMVIKPFEYVTLLVLKGVAALYALYLAIEATLAANAFERKRFLPVAIIVLVMVAASVVALGFLEV